MINKAVQNNINWCGIVSEIHGATHTVRENVWGLLSKAPMYYPDIITTSSKVTTKEVVGFIAHREIISIKDSFSNLEMTPYGFKILFEAEWIFHTAVPSVDRIDSDWHVIVTEEELLRWTSANGLENIIKPDILKREGVKIFVLEKNGQQSGFIANSGAGAVGISNVFSANSLIDHLWLQIADVVSTEFPGFPMVGYEHGDDLKEAIRSGWKSIGPLRVWLKE